MFGLFFKKKEVEKIKEDTKKGFESVREDMSSFSSWINHLDSEKKLHKKDIEEIKEILSTIKEEFDELKNFVSLERSLKIKQTPKQLSNKQTTVYPVQTAVQTAVQTPNLEQFSISEKAIIWLLLNTDMKLSYNDIAIMLGKERSTIRGQINTIKQKSEGIIQESIELNGKKRVFIDENIKEKLLKKQKVRIKKNKKIKKSHI
jgi:hypothetical protein